MTHTMYPIPFPHALRPSTFFLVLLHLGNQIFVVGRTHHKGIQKYQTIRMGYHLLHLGNACMDMRNQMPVPKVVRI